MSQKKTNGGAQKTAQAGVEAFGQGYEQFVAVTQEQVEKFLPGAGKGLDEFTKLGKDNMDAAIEAGTIAAKGFEAIGKEVTDFNKMLFEAGVANAQAMMGIKTVQEAMELQTGFARNSFDEFVAKGTKISEMSVKVAQDVAEPVNARFTATVGQLTKQNAA